MKRVTVVATQEQIESWREAAFDRRMTMSEWIRRALDAQVKPKQKEGASA